MDPELLVRAEKMFLRISEDVLRFNTYGTWAMIVCHDRMEHVDMHHDIYYALQC